MKLERISEVVWECSGPDVPVRVLADDVLIEQIRGDKSLEQLVNVAGECISFERGETIWTESSYKYDSEQLTTVTAAAGFAIERLWTDADDRFWVALLVA